MTIVTSRVLLGLESRDKRQIALDKLFGLKHDYKRVFEGQMSHFERGAELDSSVRAFKNLREAYVEATGDGEVSFQSRYLRASEDITSQDFPNLLNNSLGRLLLRGYREMDFGIDLLVPQQNRGAVPDFKTQERVRVGYFDDLDDIDPESAEYQEIAKPTDEKASAAIGQKGNLLPITRRTIIDDDTGGITQLVAKLGWTARRTLAQAVFDLMIANAPTSYDGITWAHSSSHGANLRTAALDSDELEAIAAAMFLQTEKDSAKAIGIEQSILVVPRGLKAAAMQANQYRPVEASPNPNFHRYGENNERIIVSPLLTDPTDFYNFADQNEVPCIELGFLQGRQDPEFFLANAPTEGRAFSQDIITYKVRHEYYPLVIDHRGYAKNVVAD